MLPRDKRVFSASCGLVMVNSALSNFEFQHMAYKTSLALFLLDDAASTSFR